MMSPVAKARAALVPPQPGHDIPVHFQNQHPVEMSLTTADTHSAQHEYTIATVGDRMDTMMN